MEEACDDSTISNFTPSALAINSPRTGPTPRQVSSPNFTAPGAELFVVSLKARGSPIARPTRSVFVSMMRCQVDLVSCARAEPHRTAAVAKHAAAPADLDAFMAGF